MAPAVININDIVEYNSKLCIVSFIKPTNGYHVYDLVDCITSEIYQDVFKHKLMKPDVLDVGMTDFWEK